MSTSPSEEIRSRHALEQRATRDVESRPGTSGDREQDEGAQCARKGRDPHERQAPDDDRDHEWNGQPRHSDEARRYNDGDYASGAERRGEVSRPISAPKRDEPPGSFTRSTSRD
jgi:hypothetical protein